jgi:hypothetical protein
MLSRAVRPGDLLGDAAAAGRMVPPGAAADVAGWAATWMLRHCRVVLAELQAAGLGASLQAAFCLGNLGVATVTAERWASDTERAEALSQLRTALCLFTQAPAPDKVGEQQRRDAVLACLDALPSALPAPEHAADVAKAQLPQPQLSAGAGVAKVVALALLVSLCADAAMLAAALPTLSASLLRAGAAALRLAAAAALLLHAAHAAVTLVEMPRLRPKPAKAAEKVQRAAPGALKVPSAAEKVHPLPTHGIPSPPSMPPAASPLPQTPQTPQTPPRARFSDDVSASPGAALAAAVVSASSPGAALAAAAFGVALKPALAAPGPQAKRAADEAAAKRAAAAEQAATAARWTAAVRAATRPSPGPFIRTVVHL